MAPRQLSAEHKASMAAGRTEGRSVKAYLDALQKHKPRRGRKRTTDSIKKRMTAIETALAEAPSLKRLQLLQERRDLEAELARVNQAVDLTKLEAGFVKVASAYGQRKGIAYATWRELGVPAEVLAKAGVKRGG